MLSMRNGNDATSYLLRSKKANSDVLELDVNERLLHSSKPGGRLGHARAPGKPTINHRMLRYWQCWID